MRITQVPEYISFRQLVLRPHLFLGAPGIGKTAVLSQAAARYAKLLGRVFVDLRYASDEQLADVFRNPERYFVFYRVAAPHVFAEDLGVPRPRRISLEYTDFVPIKYFAVFSIPGIAGVLFVDEITNLSNPEQESLWFTILQERVAAWSIKFSNQVAIVLAGNKPEHSAVANELPAPLLNRMRVIEVEPPSLEEWLYYMSAAHGEDWAPEVYVFLRDNPMLFHREPETSRGLENYPTPRSWESVALLLAEFKKRFGGRFAEWPQETRSVFSTLVAGDVGSEAASNFIGFLEIDLPSIEDFMENPRKWWSTMNPVQRRVIAAMVAQNIVKPVVYTNAAKLVDVFRDDREAFMMFVAVVRGVYFNLLSKYQEGDKDFVKTFKAVNDALILLSDEVYADVSKEISEKIKAIADSLVRGQQPGRL